MKIALIGTSHPYRGGLADYNNRLAAEFQNQGHEVKIYTFTVQYPSFLFPGKTQYTTSPKPEGLDIERSINSISPFNWLNVGNKIKKEKYDLVIIKFWLPFMGPCFGTILRRIKSNKHTKIITIIDNMIPHESRIGDKAFTKYFVKPLDAFVAMSKSVLDDINHFDKTKPRLLSPHPLFDNYGKKLSKDEACKHLNLDPSTRYILFFGLIRKYKGLDLLLEAFSDEKFRNKNIKLIIAGEYYTDKEEYMQLIEKYQLAKDIIQIDQFIENEDVKYYFSAADLIAQPYKTATQSGVTQIAYHFNTPMIVTDVGGLKELCPDQVVGYVVKPNAQEIANALLRFFDHNEKEKFELNIEKEKKKYEWGILVENILKLQKQIPSKQ